MSCENGPNKFARMAGQISAGISRLAGKRSFYTGLAVGAGGAVGGLALADEIDAKGEEAARRYIDNMLKAGSSAPPLDILRNAGAAPVAVSYGINPVHLGIIFLANMQIGYFTPPVGMNLFIASYRFEQPVTRIYLATLPWFFLLFGAVLIQLLKRFDRERLHAAIGDQFQRLALPVRRRQRRLVVSHQGFHVVPRPSVPLAGQV